MTGNQLKILALITMTIDHIGFMLLPEYPVLRIIGRLSFPIFAFMIAEGCFYTHNKRKYIGLIAALAVACQLVYFFAMGSCEQSILTTLTLSIATIYAFQWWEARAINPEGKAELNFALMVPIAVLAIDIFVCNIMPGLLSSTDFKIDYGFMGVLLPLFCYMPRFNTSEHELQQREQDPKRLLWQQLGLMAVGLALLAWAMMPHSGTTQWWGLFALLPLASYSGKRGKWRMKYLFYIYYPLHLVVIQGISYLLQQ